MLHAKRKHSTQTCVRMYSLCVTVLVPHCLWQVWPDPGLTVFVSPLQAKHKQTISHSSRLILAKKNKNWPCNRFESLLNTKQMWPWTLTLTAKKKKKSHSFVVFEVLTLLLYLSKLNVKNILCLEAWSKKTSYSKKNIENRLYMRSLFSERRGGSGFRGSKTWHLGDQSSRPIWKCHKQIPCQILSKRPRWCPKLNHVFVFCLNLTTHHHFHDVPNSAEVT